MPYQAPKVELNASAFRRRRLSLSAVLSAAAAAVVSLSSSAQASAPSLTLNGSPANAVQVERNEHVFVPAQSVFSELGETVATKSQQVVVKSKAGTELARMTLGSREATMKGSAQTLAGAPFTAHGALMVPLRFVSEAAGATVAYSSNPRAIDIHKAAMVAAAPTAVVAQAAAPTVQATDAATAAPATAAAAAPADTGIPWWVWLLAALVILGLIFAFLRRKKEPVIVTSGAERGGDPKITTRH